VLSPMGVPSIFIKSVELNSDFLGGQIFCKGSEIPMLHK
jgi:hypothetical protein